MRVDIFKLLVSLLKERRWREELNRVCPSCCEAKTADQDICWCCLNREMVLLRGGMNQEPYQLDGFSIGNTASPISRQVYWTDKQKRPRTLWKEFD